MIHNEDNSVEGLEEEFKAKNKVNEGKEKA